MIKYYIRLCYSLAVIFLTLLLVSCSGGGGGVVADGGGSGSGGTTGTLVLGLTDAPGDYSHIFITIREVQVNQATEAEGDASGWLTILTPNQTYDLMDLVNGTIQNLGATELEAGQYNQMRLILAEETPAGHPYANYLIIEGDEGNPIELTVPSGPQTGIKLVNGFAIMAGDTTELVLDFDANKSIVQAGNSGQWHLKPTIKVVDTINNTLQGTVTDAGDSLAEAGVAVTAQLYDSGAAPENAVSVAGAGITDGDGAYAMFLPSGTYNVVAFKEGFVPACTETVASPIGVHGQDFLLLPAADTGTFTGTVNGLTSADSALFSIRQTVDCGAGDVVIEVASFSVADGFTSIPLVLPVGSYDVVVTAEGDATYTETVAITSGADTDVIFPPPPPLP